MDLLSKVVVTIYFIMVMFPTIFLLLCMPYFLNISVNAVIKTGFASNFTLESFVYILGFIIAISMLVPPLRKMYHFFPWLFLYIEITFINLIIMCIGVMILNYGYEIVDKNRHCMFIILTVVTMLILRILMCISFRVRPLGDKREENK